MKITLKEVAKLAGVHRSTVDKVIHNRVGVSDEVRQRVRNILEEVGYEPNELGQALQKRQEIFRVAVLLLKVDALQTIQAGIEKGLERYRNFNIEIEYYYNSFNAAAEQAKRITMLVQEKVDGMILMPVSAPEVRDAMAYAADKKVPVITTNMDLENAERLCFVGQHSRQAGRIAARLMGEFLGGSGTVGIIASTKSDLKRESLDDRENSFIKHMAQVFPKVELLETVHTYDDPKTVLKSALDMLSQHENLDGLYVTGGGVQEVGKAIKLSQYNQKCNFRVICFEAYPAIIDLLKEGIITCTISSGLEQQGSLPVKLLMDWFVNAKTPDMQHQITESKILFKENFM